MHSSISNSDVADQAFHVEECRFLRRYGWLLAAVGIPVGCVLIEGRWGWATGDVDLWPDSWTAFVTVRGLLLGLCLAAIPWLWWIGILLEKRMSLRWRPYPVAPLLALAAVVFLELGFRSFSAQELFWQAVRARAGDNYFTREVAFVNLSHNDLARRSSVPRGIILNGSSQLLHAIDRDTLASLTGLPVYLRATAGMFPMESLAAIETMMYPGDHLFVTLRSGVDLAARDRFMVNALHSLMTPIGFRELIRSADPKLRVRYWREWIRLWCASESALWRARDYFRLLIAEPIVKQVAVSHVESRPVGREAPGIRDEHRQWTGAASEYIHMSDAAFRRFVQLVSRHYEQCLIIEGTTHPEFGVDVISGLNERFRMLMDEFADHPHVVWILREDQPFLLAESDWLDNVHVAESGRILYTEFVARLIMDRIAD